MKVTGRNVEDRLLELVEEAGGTMRRDDLLREARERGVAKTHALNVLKHGRRELLMGNVYARGRRGSLGSYVCTVAYARRVVDRALEAGEGKVYERELRDAMSDGLVPGDLVGDGLLELGYSVRVVVRGGLGETRVWEVAS